MNAAIVVLHGQPYTPLDQVARDGRSHLLSDGRTAVLARWDGAQFVYPATGSIEIDIEPRWRYAPEGRDG